MNSNQDVAGVTDTSCGCGCNSGSCGCGSVMGVTDTSCGCGNMTDLLVLIAIALLIISVFFNR